MHLLSTYRYPLLPHVHPDKVTLWLLEAPRIARDTAPFFWNYLDSPRDGTIFLTWQPMELMGPNFSSDGYIFAGPETAFQLQVQGGYVSAALVVTKELLTNALLRF